MIPPDTWRNVAVSGEPVAEGEQISMKIEGGYVRRPAPQAGVVYKLPDDSTVFVPETVIQGGTYTLPAPEKKVP